MTCMPMHIAKCSKDTSTTSPAVLHLLMPPMKSLYNGIKIMTLQSESNPSPADILHDNNVTCKINQSSPFKLLHVDSLFNNK
eukprot:6812235-Ditylum_brightwellii.AAC.1